MARRRRGVVEPLQFFLGQGSSGTYLAVAMLSHGYLTMGRIVQTMIPDHYGSE